jgi:hypothetical protein
MGTFWRSWTKVDSFRRMGLRARFYQAIFYSEGPSNLAITIPSHCAGNYLILGHYQAGRTGPRHWAP